MSHLRVPCASVSKRVFAQNLSCENDLICMKMNVSAEHIFIWMVSHDRQESFWHKGNWKVTRKWPNEWLGNPSFYLALFHFKILLAGLNNIIHLSTSQKLDRNRNWPIAIWRCAFTWALGTGSLLVILCRRLSYNYLVAAIVLFLVSYMTLTH